MADNAKANTPGVTINQPMTSSENEDFSALSLDEWITKFGRIYGKRHDKHTTEYMISRLVEEVAELVNPMEAQDIAQISPNLADVFSWICSLAYKLNIDLSALAWQKYGKNAPRPSWARDETAPKQQQPSLADFSQPRVLREWQNFISKLYQNENARLTPMNALVAMMKDVGDLAMLHRKRASQEQFTSKLAAILAWTFTLSQLLKLDLATVVFSKYDNHCPVCLQPVCDTNVCHPFATMYVSFGNGTSDEEKYVVLDSAAKYGFKTLVNPSPTTQSTKDLSNSLDLINKSDAACILLSSSGTNSEPSRYRQIFETLSCYSILSKGNIWIFAKDARGDFGSYLSDTFGSESVVVVTFTDANHLRALFEEHLERLKTKVKSLSKLY